MKFKSKVFPYALVGAEQLELLSAEIQGQRENIAAYGAVGYALVNDHLVPYSFITRVSDNLRDEVFDYDSVFDAREMVGDTFYDTLTDAERCVLAPCLLMLIEQGSLPMIFHGDHGSSY